MSDINLQIQENTESFLAVIEKWKDYATRLESEIVELKDCINMLHSNRNLASRELSNSIPKEAVRELIKEFNRDYLSDEFGDREFKSGVRAVTGEPNKLLEGNSNE